VIASPTSPCKKDSTWTRGMGWIVCRGAEDSAARIVCRGAEDSAAIIKIRTSSNGFWKA